MSIRAYRLIEIKTEKEPTLESEEITNALKYANDSQYSEGGILSFDEDILTEALKTEEDYKTRQAIKKILKDLPADDNFIEYYCY